SGRALLGFSSVFTAPPPAAGPYAYMAGVAGVTLVKQDFNNIDPTPDGLAIGVNDTLDVSYWHQYFSSYPSFLKVLGYVSGTANAAALGGSHISIPITCPNPVAVPCPTTISLTGQVFNAGCQLLTVTWKVDGVPVQTNLVPANTPNASLTMTRYYVSGNHTVTLTASDGVLSPSCNTAANVGAIPLAVSCPASIVTNTTPGQCTAVVTYNVTASKDCVAVTNVVCNPLSGYTFPKGVTTVTCTADDGAGHTANCSFNVTVIDAQAPAFVCPANIVTNPPPGIFQVPVNFAIPTPTDNCPGVSMVCTPASGSMFSDGATLVTCKATDAAGNTNLCIFVVTVNTTNATISPLIAQTKCQGETAVFSTVPSGPGPFTFAWRLDSNPVGTNGPALAIATGSLSIGNHSVQVSMTNGNSVVSSTATLTVGSLTSATPLTNLTRCVCESAVFATTPIGTGPFSFLWLKDGQVLPNQSSNSLTLQSLKTASAGTYSVVVAGTCNRVTNSATLTLEGSDNPTSPLVLTNEAYLPINDFGPATPYPSVINVKCISGTIRKLTVTLYSLTHTFPGDIDLLLVGPNGQALKLMSDAGNYFEAEDATLTFDDDAADFLPQVTGIVTGTFKPTDYEEFDSFDNPAPSPPYTNRLSAFIGSGLNGNWSLYVMDDETLDAGSIGHGWSLRFDWDITHPQLRSPLKLGDGRYQFTLSGEVGRTHVIQRSTNLQNWISVSTNTLTGTNLIYVEPSATNASPGYYRALCCP
ncbi:MAG: HYR domain-containing protein, partial [Verrucomicrobia bacterium]